MSESGGERERGMTCYSMREEKERDRAGEDRKRIEANSVALEFTTTGTGIGEKQRTNKSRTVTFSWTCLPCIQTDNALTHYLNAQLHVTRTLEY